MNRKLETGLIFVVVIGAVVVFGNISENKASKERGEKYEYTAKVGAECQKAIKAGWESGLLRQIDGDTAFVEERLWSELPRHQQAGLMSAVACQQFNEHPLNLAYHQVLVIKGYNRGERLADWGSTMVHFRKEGSSLAIFDTLSPSEAVAR